MKEDEAAATLAESLQQLAVALQALPQLVELRVEQPRLKRDVFGNLPLPAVVGALPMVTAAASLPALRSLELMDITVIEQAAAALAAASKLTRLCLRYASLRNYQVTVLVLHMPHPQELDLSDNPGFDDDVMPLIGKQLVGLRSLNLCHTRVKQLGVGLVAWPGAVAYSEAVPVGCACCCTCAWGPQGV